VKDKGKFVPILDFRKTGYLGFIVCLQSLLHLYSSLIKSGKLEHLKIYKTSQESGPFSYFSVLLDRYNNNPISRQFQSAYKKLVVHTHDTENFNTGNCIPLDHIEILH
jgi:hypothetical protein